MSSITSVQRFLNWYTADLILELNCFHFPHYFIVLKDVSDIVMSLEKIILCMFSHLQKD